MVRRLWIPLLALLAVLPAAAETMPSVARPQFAVNGVTHGTGTAFFLPAAGAAGAVAVTAAHSVELADLGRAKAIRFVLGGSGSEVAVSSRFFAPPGSSFAEPGGSLVNDHVIFALERAPSGVRILQPAAGTPADLVGQRVRVLGVPAKEQRDQQEILGTVARADGSRIEVDLDVQADLQGWGGAPVVLAANGEVVGILLAAWPSAGRLRVGVAPIAAVVGDIAHPLDSGLGQPFDRYAHVREAPEPPSPGPTRPAEAPSPGTERGPILGRAGTIRTKLDLEIREPTDGAIVNDPAGAFLAGRAVASTGTFKRFDLMLVIDTSGSTADMTRTDVNGNGVIGRNIGPQGMFGSTDPGDSVLAAEVAAARRVIRGLDPRSTRVGVITFAGTPRPPPGTFILGRRVPDVVIEQPLTTDYPRVAQALDRVLARGPDGMTYMAEGIRMGIRELLALPGSVSTADPASEKVMLFFTDGTPTLPYDPMMEAANVETVLRAADSAKRAGIKIDSFAIGPEALQGPVTTVEMAARTGGRFTPVRNPGQLVDVIDNVSLADIQQIEIRNLSNGQTATVKEINADGSFGALVPIATGKNRIEVVARATDGSEAHREVTVVYAPDAPRVEVPAPYIAQHNRLLQRRLVELRQGSVTLAQQQAEAARKELLVQIDRERAAAEQRAAAQRKELNLQVENPDATATSTPAQSPTP